MLEQERQKRQARIESQIGTLSYERLRHQKRIDAIDLELAALEGALAESERVRVDLTTEAAIKAAKTEQEVTDNG